MPTHDPIALKSNPEKEKLPAPQSAGIYPPAYPPITIPIMTSFFLSMYTVYHTLILQIVSNSCFVTGVIDRRDPFLTTIILRSV